MPMSTIRLIDELFARCLSEHGATSTRLVLEILRRVNLAFDVLGTNEENLRIAAVLLMNDDADHSFTVLLNETGLSRSTLQRRLELFVRHGLVSRVGDGQVYYHVTERGVAMAETMIHEITAIIRSQRIGFSPELRKAFEEVNFEVKPAAKPLAFPSISAISARIGTVPKMGLSTLAEIANSRRTQH